MCEIKEAEKGNIFIIGIVCIRDEVDTIATIENYIQTGEWEFKNSERPSHF